MVVKNPVLLSISLGSRSPNSTNAVPGAVSSNPGGDGRLLSTAGAKLSGGGETPYAVPLSSYPCIHSDPGAMLINGQSMRGSITTPSVRLANFDK